MMFGSQSLSILGRLGSSELIISNLILNMLLRIKANPQQKLCCFNFI